MKLPADGREYIQYDVTVPASQDMPDAVSVELIDGTWTATTYVSWEADTMTIDGVTVAANTSTWKVLVAGPDGAGNGAVVLPLGRTTTRVRVVGEVESIIRAAGPIDVA
jgi:hypothetical protein